mmetsp:Transcript_29351/g.73694  ORF Transcript_29351/g.73694 Transcript_29351/m.73694 type:complete len:481 (+) Transcript_29351:97-1539(+)
MLHLPLLTTLLVLLPALLRSQPPNAPMMPDDSGACNAMQEQADSANPVENVELGPLVIDMSGDGSTAYYFSCFQASQQFGENYFMYAMLTTTEGAGVVDLNLTYDYSDDDHPDGHREVYRTLNTGGSIGLQTNSGNLCSDPGDGNQAFPDGVKAFTLTVGAQAGQNVNVEQYAFALIRNDLSLENGGVGNNRELVLTNYAAEVATLALTDVDEGHTYDFNFSVNVDSGGSNTVTVTFSSDCGATADDGQQFTFTGESGSFNLTWKAGSSADTFFVRFATTTSLITSTRMWVTGTDGGGDGGSPCFPASAAVQLASDEAVAMESIKLGDVVATGEVDTPASSIFLFTHKNSHKMYPFVRLHTEDGGAIALSGSHYIFSNGKLITATSVSRGDLLIRGDGVEVKVVAKEDRVWLRGLYNPHTATDTMVVDGFKVSCLTAAMPPFVARALLFPFKVLGMALPDAFFDSARWVERWIPNGRVSY